MNKVILMGRLVRDPDVRYTADNQPVARFTLAVDRRVAKNNGQNEADFINCIAFTKKAEFAEKYLNQGIKVVLTGRIQTGSYTNKDGQKVYTTDVIAEDIEFAESKVVSGQKQESKPEPKRNDGFMEIPDDVDDGGLPFN